MAVIEKWIEIKAPVEHVFDLLGQTGNFPQWMRNVEIVKRSDNQQALLKKCAASGAGVEWRLEPLMFEPHRRLAWRLASDATSAQAEAIFEETRRGTTLMRFVFSDETPRTQPSAADFFGEHPAQALEESVQRFKHLAEQDDDDEDAATVIKLPRAEKAATTERETKEFSAPAVAEAARNAQANESIHRATSPRRSVLSLLHVILTAVALALITACAVWLFTAKRHQTAAADTQAQLPSSNATPTASPSSSIPFQTATSEHESKATKSVSNNGSTNQSLHIPARVNSSSAGNDTATERSSAEAHQRTELRVALNEWLTAINAHSIDKEMSLYAPTIERYYLRRNLSQANVRADKLRLAARARLIDVIVSEPEIIFAPDGNSATMIFRKQYNIEGSRFKNRGEVVQELKWLKTKAGWRIINERDVKVIR